MASKTSTTLKEKASDLGKVYSRAPILIFWETTKACALACRHCRASAIHKPLPGELTTDEALDLIKQIAEFGHPRPIIVFTGGDCLNRPDLFHLANAAKESGIHFAFSPSVTPLLDQQAIQKMRQAGAKVVSVSLDGSTATTHESIRGITGHFADTLDAIDKLKSAGFRVQVNTTVWKRNLLELPELLQILLAHKVDIWEVFFLIKVGRGLNEEPLSPEESEAVAMFLAANSNIGITIRTVEAPFYRRVITGEYVLNDKIASIYSSLMKFSSYPNKLSIESFTNVGATTRDGNGVIFISHDGNVYPSGFLPLSLGNVRQRSIVEIYRESPLLVQVRNANFKGKCGVCLYRYICGGSRARAYFTYGDPLAEDPACAYLPMNDDADHITKQEIKNKTVQSP